jgi:hypothetical protein
LNNHYTAVVLGDGAVMSVPDRTIHTDIHAWGATLPEWRFKDVLVNQYGKNPAPYSNLFQPASPQPVAAAAAAPAAPLKKKVQSSQYLYPYKTILRYYPDDSEKHVTAIVLSEKHILQTKPEKETFSSVDEWLEFLSDEQNTGEEIYEEDLTAEVPGYAEYPILKCNEQILPRRKIEADDVEKTLTAAFDGMRIKITGPIKKAQRSLDAIFQAMQV